MSGKGIRLMSARVLAEHNPYFKYRVTLYEVTRDLRSLRKMASYTRTGACHFREVKPGPREVVH